MATPLGRLLAPKSLAFVGGARAADCIRNARAGGFGGRMYTVNPKAQELEGIRCVPRIADLPEPPDACFLGIPVEASIEAVGELARIGAGGAVCYAAGFAETGAAGRALQQLLADAAGTLAVVGPNSYGLINYVNGGSLFPSPFPVASPAPSVAMVAQSGNLCITLANSQRCVPWRYLLSVGNQAVLGVEDYLDHFADDPDVRAIGVFLEGLRDVAGFHRAALRAAERGVPVVVLKSGASKEGARLAMTHTSSLAGTDAMYDALFARTGVIRVRSVPELQEQLKLLSVWGSRVGRRTVVFSTSGGDSGMAADYASSAGLELPQPDGDQEAALRRVLPDYGAVSNPLDFTAVLWGQQEPLTELFRTLMARGADSAVLVLDGPREGTGATAADKMGDALIAARDATGLHAAVASVVPESGSAEFRLRMLRAGIAPLQGTHDAFNVIAAAAAFAEFCARETRPAPLHGAGGRSGDAPRTHDEWATKCALARHGLPVPAARACALWEVAAAATGLGFPVAVKALHPGLTHKTEAGGVMLGVMSPDAAEQAARQIAACVAAYDPLLVVEQFLVERMVVDPVAELIIGIHTDPQFGPCLVLGPGGVLVEAIAATSMLLLPATEAEVETLLHSGVTGALLGGFRGRPRGDIRAVTKAVLAIASFAAANAERLLELDVNPLFVLGEGQGAVAVDAVMRTLG